MRMLLCLLLSLALVPVALTQIQPAAPPQEVVTRGGPGVSAPVVLEAPAPTFTEQERREKISGNVLVYCQVGTDGLPSKVQVVRGLRADLDNKAVEAVKLYRFQPAMKDGHPVRIEMRIEVNFKITDQKQN